MRDASHFPRLQAAEKEAVARREEAQVAAAAAGGDAMDAEPANTEGEERQVSPRAEVWVVGCEARRWGGRCCAGWGVGEE